MMLPDSVLDEYRRRKEQKRIDEASTSAAKTGGISGALLGGLSGLLQSNGSVGKMAGKALLGGAGGAAVGGGSTYLGSEILGAPEEGAPGGFTNRGLLGGAVAGGLGGAGLGALLGGGRLKWLMAAPGIRKVASGAGDSLVGKGVKALMASPNASKKTAAALGLGGAVIGAHTGSGEGMQLDYLNSLDDERDPRGPY